MDHADDDDVFVYMGGDHEVPEDVTHVRVHKSVKIITRRAFYCCIYLVSIEMHHGVEIIEEEAFCHCEALRGINLSGVRVIGVEAFQYCTALENVEFGDKLESIEGGAFQGCTPLRIVKLHTVRYIGICAFAECPQLTEVQLLSEDLERIDNGAFIDCPSLRRIFIPLKDNLLVDEDVEDHGGFYKCDALSQVDLIGGIHKTVSSLLLDSWKNEMKDEIDIINQVLPYYDDDKTPAIRQWIRSVLQRIEHFKREHYALLKEDMTLLELALWKSSLPNNIDAADRQQARVTCGANIMIPHVLSFLNDDDVFPSLNQSIE
jgi:hypothetical protein